MNLNETFFWKAQYNRIIGVNSNYYVHVPQQAGMHRIEMFIYTHRGTRATMSGIAPTATINKPFINTQSLDIEVTKYVKHLLTNNQEYTNFADLDDIYDEAMWSGWIIKIYNSNNNVINTIKSDMHLLTTGFSFANLDNIHAHNPAYDSDYHYDEQFLDEYDVYMEYNVEFPVNSLKYVNKYNLLETTTQPESEFMIVPKFNSRMVGQYLPTNCNIEYEILFINKVGAWQLFPLGGKVVKNNEIKKTPYNINVRNVYTMRNDVRFSQMETSTSYTWNSYNYNEALYNYIEQIAVAPLIVLHNTTTGLFEYVYVESWNQPKKTRANNRNQMSYIFTFKSNNKKIK